MRVPIRRFLGTAVCAVMLAAALATPGSATRKVDPPVKLPDRPTGLAAPVDPGPNLDPLAGYQPQLACADRALPGVRKLRKLTLATYGRGGTSPARPRSCATGGVSEHKEGRAWDWMVDVKVKKDRKAAADFLAWVTAKNGRMAARLGIMYVIYNHRIWSSYSPGWRDYSGYDPHTSHVHISLSWNGARADTSFWTGRTWPLDYGTCQVFAGQPAIAPTNKARTTPCPSPVPSPRTSKRPMVWLGSTGNAVGQAQELLGLTVTRTFDRTTRDAVLGYQKTHDLPRTGAVDDPTWASLDPSLVKTTAREWKPKAAVRWAARKDYPDIRRGDAGKAVAALQAALRLDPSLRTGYYGRGTLGAVREAKRRLGLSATPRVTTELWRGLPLARR